jgi:hypothetical protein
VTTNTIWSIANRADGRFHATRSEIEGAARNAYAARSDVFAACVLVNRFSGDSPAEDDKLEERVAAKASRPQRPNRDPAGRSLPVIAAPPSPHLEPKSGLRYSRRSSPAGEVPRVDVSGSSLAAAAASSFSLPVNAKGDHHERGRTLLAVEVRGLISCSGGLDRRAARASFGESWKAL